MPGAVISASVQTYECAPVTEVSLLHQDRGPGAGALPGPPQVPFTWLFTYILYNKLLAINKVLSSIL